MLYSETYIDAQGKDTAYGPFKAEGFRPIVIGGSQDNLPETIEEAKRSVQYYRSIGHDSFAIVYLQCDHCKGYGQITYKRRHKRTGAILRQWTKPCLSCLGAESDLQMTERITL